MDGYHIRIDAFDQDPDAEDRFAAQSPDLISPVYNGVRVEGEVEYTIRIHSGYNLSSKRFADAISKLDSTTYVFVSLGSDEENIKAALRLRMLFARLSIYPRIQAVVYDSDKKEALKDIRNFKDQPYNIECVGDLESTYTESVILDSELEKDALRRHMAWLKLTDKTPEEQAEAKRQEEAKFWGYEYNYRSSVATAIHARARIRCGIPGADKNEKDRTLQERDAIELLEHRRWNAYMRSEGYIYTDGPRNELAKMHPSLVDFSALSEEEKRKDSAVTSE